MAMKLFVGADSFYAGRDRKPRFDVLYPKTIALIKHYESLGCMILDCNNSEIRLVGLDNVERLFNIIHSYVVDGIVVDVFEGLNPLPQVSLPQMSSTQVSVDLHHAAMTPNNEAVDQLKSMIVESGQQIVYGDSDSVFVELDDPTTLEQRIREIFGPDNLKCKYENTRKVKYQPVGKKRYRSFTRR